MFESFFHTVEPVRPHELVQTCAGAPPAPSCLIGPRTGRTAGPPGSGTLLSKVWRQQHLHRPGTRREERLDGAEAICPPPPPPPRFSSLTVSLTLINNNQYYYDHVREIPSQQTNPGYTPTRSFWSAAHSATCAHESTTPSEEG